MAATAGRLVRVKQSGTGVSATAEATTATGNISYQITDTAKRVWDQTATVTVYDDDVEVDAVADPYSINRLTGTVLFESATSRTITVDATYLPLSTIAEAKEFTLQTKHLNSEDTAFGDADVTRLQNESDCAGTVGQWKNTSQAFKDALDDAVPVCVEFSYNSGATIFAKAWALFSSNGISAEKKGLIEETLAFDGSADADGRSFTFLE